MSEILKLSGKMISIDIRPNCPICGKIMIYDAGDYFCPICPDKGDDFEGEF